MKSVLRFLPWLLVLFMIVACFGGSNPTPTPTPTPNPTPTPTPTPNPTEPVDLPQRTVPITINVPVTDVDESRVLTPFESKPMSSANITIADRNLVLLESKEGDVIGYTMALPNQNTLTIDARSSALALVQMHPSMWGAESDFLQKVVANADNAASFASLVDAIATNYTNNAYSPIDVTAHPRLAVLVNQVVQQLIALPELQSAFVSFDDLVTQASQVTAAEGSFKAELKDSPRALSIANPKTINYMVLARQPNSDSPVAGSENLDTQLLEAKYGVISLPVQLGSWPPVLQNPSAPKSTDILLSNLIDGTPPQDYDIILLQNGWNLTQDIGSPQWQATALNYLRGAALVVDVVVNIPDDNLKNPPSKFRKAITLLQQGIEGLEDANRALAKLQASVSTIQTFVTFLNEASKVSGWDVEYLDTTRDILNQTLVYIEFVTNIHSSPKDIDLDAFVKQSLAGFDNFASFTEAVKNDPKKAKDAVRSLLSNISTSANEQLKNFNLSNDKAASAHQKIATRMTSFIQLIASNEELGKAFYEMFIGQAVDDWAKQASEGLAKSVIGAGVVYTGLQVANTIVPYIYDMSAAPNDARFRVRNGKLIPLDQPKVKQIRIAKGANAHFYNLDQGKTRVPLALQANECVDIAYSGEVPQIFSYSRNALMEDKFFTNYDNLFILRYGISISNPTTGARNLFNREVFVTDRNIFKNKAVWTVKTWGTHPSANKAEFEFEYPKDREIIQSEGIYAYSLDKDSKGLDDFFISNLNNICFQAGDTAINFHVFNTLGMGDTFKIPVIMNTAPSVTGISREAIGNSNYRFTAIATDDGTLPDELLYSWNIKNSRGTTVHSEGFRKGKRIYTATLSAGTYSITLIVKDAQGLQSQLTRSITIAGAVSNTKPVANAGADQRVTLGQEVRLDGSQSSDADGDSLRYRWTLRTPASSSASLPLQTPNNVVSTFTPDVEGEYIATLTVSDGKLSDTDTVKISVSKQACAPVRDISGVISVDTTFTGVYGCDDFIAGTITVTNGATLTLAAGTTLKFRDAGSLFVSVNGRILVQGRENEPITFASASDKEEAYWCGIYFDNASELEKEGSIFEHTHISNSRYCQGRYYGNITLGKNRKLSLNNSVISGSSFWGLYAIHPEGELLSLKNNIFKNNNLAANLHIDDLSVVENNTFENNTNLNSIWAEGTSTQDITLLSGTSYILGHIGLFHTLTISSNVKLMFANERRLVIYENGRILAQGEKDKPITFTSAAEKKEDYWCGIYFTDVSELEKEGSIFEHTHISNSQNCSNDSFYGNITLGQNRKLSLNNSVISGSSGYGLYAIHSEGELLSLKNNIFKNNNLAANLHIDDLSVVENNTFENNTNLNSIWAEGTSTQDITLLSGTSYILGHISLFHTLTISSNVKLMFANERRLVVSKNGRILAQGEKEKPIIFTSASESSTHYWCGISFTDASALEKEGSIFEYTHISNSRYCGDAYYGNITLGKNRKLSLNNSVISGSSYYGLYIGSQPVSLTPATEQGLLNQNTFRNNASGNIRFP